MGNKHLRKRKDKNVTPHIHIHKPWGSWPPPPPLRLLLPLLINVLIRSHPWIHSLSPQWKVISEIRTKRLLLHRATTVGNLPFQHNRLLRRLYPARHFDYSRSLPQRSPLPALLPYFCSPLFPLEIILRSCPTSLILHTFDRPGTSGSTSSCSSSSSSAGVVLLLLLTF